MEHRYISLSTVLPYWPGSSTLPSFLDNVLIHDYDLTAEGQSLSMTGDLVFDTDLEFDLFGTSWVKVTMLAQENISGIPFTVSLEPNFAVDVSALHAVLTLNQDVLKRVREKPQGGWEDDIVGGVQKPVEVTLGGVGFRYTAGDDIEFLPLTQGMSATMTPVEILGTGIVVKFENIIPILSASQDRPPGVPAGFKGIYVEEAVATLPSSWDTQETSTGEIRGRNLAIGKGGVSGNLELALKSQASGEPAIDIKIGDAFEVSLDVFKISLLYSRVVNSEIRGTLTVPGFVDDYGNPVKIDVVVEVHGDGFSISAHPAAQLQVFHISDVLAVRLNRLAIGNKGSDYYIGMAGTLDIQAEIPGIGGRFLDEPIEINNFVIWSNGEIDFEAGAIPLPRIKPLKVGPVELSVSALHIGSYQQEWGGVPRKYKYIGFDGGIKTGFGGVDARGEGVKFYFTTDNGPGKVQHTFLRIEGIGVDLRIPGGVPKEMADIIISGYISMKNPERRNLNDPGAPLVPQGENETDVETEYSGTVEVAMPRVGIAGGASLRMIPSTGAFLADMSLELPTPISLGATGLGIYGFRGTVGNKYVVEKGAGENWWEFYKKPPRGIDARKFTSRNGFAVGAGASIGTMADGGRAFSSKLYFMLSVPTAFLLEGQAAVLSQRLGLDTDEDPPFFAAIFIDFEQASVTAGIGAHLDFPDGGEVLSIGADMELAFYFGRTSGWHIYIGQDEPGKRIRGTLLQLANCWAYFMMSSQGIKAGAGLDWNFKVDCGIVVVGLGAALEVAGFVSFKPVQLGGRILVSGFVELRVLGIGFRLDVKSSLEAEAPNPFIIRGSFSIILNLPWPISDLELAVSLAWYIRRELDRKEITFLLPPHKEDLIREEAEGYTTTYGLEQYRQQAKYGAKAVHMLTKESFLLNTVKRTYVPAEPHNVPPLPGNPPAPVFSGTQPPPLESWIGSFDEFIIPVDSFIDLEFTKPVKPVAPEDPDDTGGNHASIKRLGLITGGKRFSELVPPKRGASNQVEHKYLVDEVKIFYWDAAAAIWRDYDLYDLSTPLLEILPKPQLEQYLKYGHWQLSEAGEYTKLRLLARTPFDMYDYIPPVDAGFPETAIICADEGFELTCQTWEDDGIPLTYAPEVLHSDRRIRFTVADQTAEVVAFANVFDIGKSLKLEQGNRIEISLPEASRKLSLKLTTLAGRVSISYYRGQAWAPSNAATAEDGVERWNVTIPSPSSFAEQTPDTFWEMLRTLPRLARTICTTPGGPQPSPATDSLMKLVDADYFLSDIYLKQNNDEDPLSSTADFCTKVRSMFRTIIIGKTGSRPTPRRLIANVEHFYQDVKRLVADYVRLVGEPSTASVASANGFYETWMALIACTGALCERRNSVPQVVREKIGRLIDPEINRLYRKLEEENWYGEAINPRWGLGDACDQLRSVAGFLSIITLDLAQLPSLDPMEELEPYLKRLERAYLRVARSFRQADPARCDGPRCARTRDMVEIARALCIDPQVAGPTLAAITTLVSGFHADHLPELAGYLGWAFPAAVPSDLCGKLRRVLPLMIVALSAVDELPFAIRWKVRAFHDELARLMEEYRATTIDAPKGTPDATSDTFVTGWVDMLLCLCAICDQEELPVGEEEYLHDHFDPELEDVYNAVTGDLVGNAIAMQPLGTPMSGTSVPADMGDRIDGLMSFFAAALTRCSTMSSNVRTHLAGLHASLGASAQSLVTALQGSTICGALPPTLNCGIWPVVLECVRGYRLRQWELSEDVREKIGETLAPLAEQMYRAVFDVAEPDPIPVPHGQDAMAWELERLIAFFNESCLKGLDAPGQAEIQSELAAFQSAAATLRQHPDLEGADICEADGYDTIDRRNQLLGFYRLFCITPGTPPPSVQVKSVVANFGVHLDQITTILGLGPVPAASIATGDFCAIFGEVVRALVIAYAHQDELPVGLIFRMKAFMEDMSLAVAAMGALPQTPTACSAMCDSWLATLSCLAKAYRYREHLHLFSGAESAFALLEDDLALAYANVLVLADGMDVAFLPGRSAGDRCRRLRLVANYVASKGTDYATIPPVLTLLTTRGGFEDAFGAPALEAARERICAPVPGPYNPLRKRVVLSGDDLDAAVEYDDAGEPIDRIVIEPLPECATTIGCSTYIHAVCWLSDREYDYNRGLPPVDQQIGATEDMLEALKKLPQPIWRPNTVYALQVETREVVAERNGDRVEGTPVIYRRAYTFGFKTAGPAGHFHQIGDGPGSYRSDYAELAARDREGEYKLAGLKYYINREKSYPDPEGNLIDAKPLYYENARLSLAYDVDYIETMYNRWDAAAGLEETRSRLVTVIKDPAKGPSDADIVIDGGWAADLNPTARSGVRVFRNMMRNAEIDGRDCLQFDPLEQNLAAQRTVVDTGAQLKPRKLYTAIFNAVYKPTPVSDEITHEVHKYVFQTSRYRSFAEHIKSFYLDPPANTAGAVTTVSFDVGTQDRATAQLMLANPGDASLAILQRDYPEEYDRLIDGVLKLRGLLPPERTDVTIIRSGSAVLGLLVRSPEPFNNPKIPREGGDDGVAMNIYRTVQVSGLTGSIRKIFSKDLSKIFITNTDLALTAQTTVTLTFNHMPFNGRDYELLSPQTITIDIT